MNWIIVILLIWFNIIVSVKYYKLKNGIFSPPFLSSITFLGVITPQLFTLLNDSFYKDAPFLLLCFVIFSSHASFNLGFEKAAKKRRVKYVTELKVKSSLLIVIIMGIVGVYAAYSIRGQWMNTLDTSGKGLFILLVNLSYYMDYAIIILLYIFINKKEKSDFLQRGLILIIICFYVYSIIALGRRGLALKSTLLIAFFLVSKSESYESVVKRFFVVAFLVSSVINASISNIRSYLSGVGDQQTAKISVSNIFNNYTSSFSGARSEVGMDLGNALLGIEYCIENNSFDYGLSVWNGFVFNYIPKFFFGNLKEILTVEFSYQKIALNLTKSVTTMTGYFDAFASFGFFAGLKFFILGWLLGKIWYKSKVSLFYLSIYLFCISQIPLIFTHDSQALIGRLEFFLICILPLISLRLYKKNIHEKSTNFNKSANSVQNKIL